MSLIPEIQKQIDAMFKELSLSDTRKEVLQPLIEKKIQISRGKTEGENGNDIKYQVDIVDAVGEKREGVTLSQLVTEINEATAGTAIPLVENKNLSEEQMKLIAAGKLGIKDAVEKVDPNAISASELLDHPPSLDDVASGKVKVVLDDPDN